MSLFSSFREKSLKSKASQLYGTAMAQARDPAFYAHLGVDDTPDGRLSMISLHVLLILDRLTGNVDAFVAETLQPGTPSSQAPSKLAQHNGQARALARSIMEVFVEDLDQAMRELGIGDMGVPKRVKHAVGQFYANARKYQAVAMTPEDSAALEELLANMTPGISPASDSATKLKQYVLSSHQFLQDQTLGQIQSGRISFPAASNLLT